MPAYEVVTPQRKYQAVVERGILSRLGEFIPAKAGKVFIVTTEDVWQLHGAGAGKSMAGREHDVLFFPPGEHHKKFSSIEPLAEQMVAAGADRSSIVVAFGGGIVNDMGGFLAAIFMRGIPVIQIPTTLLAQVDAAIGGKTGVNLVAGKNLIGAFHQPLAVLVDPDVLRTLPDREFRSGLYEVVKYGVIASPELFELLSTKPREVLAHDPAALDRVIAESVRIKAEVVSADERESGLRRILNFGHTIGHALEAETRYSRFLHGEAVAFGMIAAGHLAHLSGLLSEADRDRIIQTTRLYGPIPLLDGIPARSLTSRLQSDKKTIQGKVHFVLPDRIGHVQVRSDVDPSLVERATELALQ